MYETRQENPPPLRFQRECVLIERDKKIEESEQNNNYNEPPLRQSHDRINSRLDRYILTL